MAVMSHQVCLDQISGDRARFGLVTACAAHHARHNVRQGFVPDQYHRSLQESSGNGVRAYPGLPECPPGQAGAVHPNSHPCSSRPGMKAKLPAIMIPPK